MSKVMAGAVLLAAGQGKRLGAGMRKANVRLAGKSLFEWSLKSLLGSPHIGEVALVVHAEDLGTRRRWVLRQRFKKRVIVTVGGNERQDSVERGIAALDPSWPVLLIHDAARPFLARSLIDSCVLMAAKRGAAIAAVPVSDSIKLIEDNRLKSLPRDRLLAAQTPQAASAGILRRAHAWALARSARYTDEASLLEARGHHCMPVLGYPENFKITDPLDLVRARITIKTFRFGR